MNSKHINSLPPSFFVSHTRGIVCIVLAVFFFAGVDSCSKLIHHYAPVVFTNFIRYVLLILCISLLLFKKQRRRELVEVNSLPLLLLRGVFQGGTGIFYLLAMQTLPLNLAASFYFTAPVFVVALSPSILKEKVTLKQWFCVLAAFVGMLFIVRPAFSASPVGLFWIFLAMLCLVFLYILTRKLSSKVKNWQQMFYGNLGALLSALVALPMLGPIPETFPIDYYLTFIALISFTLLGQFFLIKSFSLAPASILAPFTYLQLVFVVTISFLFFNEHLDIISLLGISIILVSGVFASRK